MHNVGAMLYRVGAEFLFLALFSVVVTVLFGWLFPSIWPLYMVALAGTFLSNITLRRCVLSDWEFSLRRRYDPTTSYDYSYSSFYTYKLTKQRISDGFLLKVGLVFTGVSFVANLVPLLIS